MIPLSVIIVLLVAIVTLLRKRQKIRAELKEFEARMEMARRFGQSEPVWKRGEVKDKKDLTGR